MVKTSDELFGSIFMQHFSIHRCQTSVVECDVISRFAAIYPTRGPISRLIYSRYTTY